MLGDGGGALGEIKGTPDRSNEGWGREWRG